MTIEDMSEAERAEYDYANRALIGAAEDSEIVEVKGPERLTIVVSVRLTPADAAELRQAAELAGVAPSAYLRSAGLTQARGDSEREIPLDFNQLNAALHELRHGVEQVEGVLHPKQHLKLGPSRPST